MLVEEVDEVEFRGRRSYQSSAWRGCSGRLCSSRSLSMQAEAEALVRNNDLVAASGEIASPTTSSLWFCPLTINILRIFEQDRAVVERPDEGTRSMVEPTLQRQRPGRLAGLPSSPAPIAETSRSIAAKCALVHRVTPSRAASGSLPLDQS